MRVRSGSCLTVAVAMVLAIAACAGEGSPTTGSGTPATTIPTTSTTVTAPTTRTPVSSPPITATSNDAPSGDSTVIPDEHDQSRAEETETPIESPGGNEALGALASFFTAVADTYQKLKAAAALINAGIHDGTATFDKTTIEAIDRGSPFTAAATIPAGLDPTVEQAVLLVYSDLVSRYGALRGGDCVQEGARPLSELNADCFVFGHEPANLMPGDIEAAYAAAAADPDVAGSDPASRERAELLLRIEYINKANLGCGTMGGFRATDAIPVEWVNEDSGYPEVPTDGRVNGIPFTATYDAGAGWTVDLRAC